MNKQQMISIPQPTSRRVNVTKSIIDNASSEHAGQCMVALALRKSVPGCESISVDASSIRFNTEGFRYCYQTPGRVSTEISQFDDDKSKVKPFNFYLKSSQCTIAPIMVKNQLAKTKKPHTKRSISGERRCKRRYHGIVTNYPINASKTKTKR